jgi:hypothetical protein
MDLYGTDDFVVSEMLGKTFTRVENTGEEIIFRHENGDDYIFHHFNSCCESVTVEDVVGDLNDLVGVPILEAEVVIDSGYDDDHESRTWTFYKFGTIKGHVNIRWFGSSNGYYSESVDQSIVRANEQDDGDAND